MPKVLCGHAIIPEWLGFAGDAVPQASRESPQLWNILLDEVTAPILKKWQRNCHAIPCLPSHPVSGNFGQTHAPMRLLWRYHLEYAVDLM